MPKLVNSDSISECLIRLLDCDANISSLSDLDENSACPLKTFLTLANSADLAQKKYNVWLAADDEVEHLKDYMGNINLVALDLDNFMDGRLFSHARILREHLDFKGEIQAHGNFLQDQMFYLSRCGVSSFCVNDDANIESLQNSLSDFSESYQAACDEPQPLFRRRA